MGVPATVHTARESTSRLRSCDGQVWHVSCVRVDPKGTDLSSTPGQAVLSTSQELAAGAVPTARAVVKNILLEKGQTLERHCMKRESGSFGNKAPECTKPALKK